MNTDSAQCLVNQVIKSKPVTAINMAARSDDQIDLVARIAELATAPPPLTTPMRDTLDEVCRKLSVTKTLSTRYTAHWRRADNSAPLGPAELQQLTAVLVAHSRPTAGDEASYGRALKYFNAALATLALAEEADRGTACTQLRTECEALLREIEASRVQGFAS